MKNIHVYSLALRLGNPRPIAPFHQGYPRPHNILDIPDKSHVPVPRVLLPRLPNPYTAQSKAGNIEYNQVH